MQGRAAVLQLPDLIGIAHHTDLGNLAGHAPSLGKLVAAHAFRASAGDA